jgi:hypothetical protein
MLTSEDRNLIRAQLKGAFSFLLRRITGESDPEVRERLAFAGNAVRDAARWLAAGGDPALILFALKEISMDDLSPEAAWRIRSIRLVCHAAMASDIHNNRNGAISKAEARARSLLAVRFNEMDVD